MNTELVTVREVADAIGTSPQNIRQSYKNKKDKQKFYEILKIGVFVKKHNIDIEEVAKIHAVSKAIENGR